MYAAGHDNSGRTAPLTRVTAAPLRSQLLEATTPMLVLTVIADGELYGYEIAQRIAAARRLALVPPRRA
jgi:hypothetical protein